MKETQRKPGEATSEVIGELPLACQDEDVAVTFMEKQRWGDMPMCPHCGGTEVHMMRDKTGDRNKRYLWRCRKCKKQFTVKVGTIMQDSPIPVRVWCFAFWAACASKKGVSAKQIERQCSITYKSALFLMHRIRYAMSEPNKDKKLSGTVEVDETYVGGKPRYKGTSKKGRGTSKTPVVGMVERKGNIHAEVIANVSGKTLKKAIREHVDRSSRMITDELSSYKFLGKEYEGGHEHVSHGWGEYVRGDVYTNTIESFFALLKRGVIGTFHAISKKHLPRYVDEFAFRWNTRQCNDGERVVAAIKGASGKRLTYYQPIGKSV